MQTTAVVDRFEEDHAVILVGQEEAVLVVERSQLPPGTREGHWLKVEVEDDRILAMEVDHEETARARARIRGKLAKLRRGEHRR